MLRYVLVHADIELVDPTTHKPVEGGKITMKDVIQRLTSNPMWVESYPAVKSANAITKAFDEGVVGTHVILAEDDWKRLCEAVETPKYVTPQGQGSIGFGWHPSLVPQLLPFLDAIMQAGTTKP